MNQSINDEGVCRTAVATSGFFSPFCQFSPGARVTSVQSVRRSVSLSINRGAMTNDHGQTNVGAMVKRERERTQGF